MCRLQLAIGLCVSLAACTAPLAPSAEREERGTMPQLEVGKVYRAEDGRSTYRYVGEGKLEKWGLERYLVPEPSKR